MKITDIDVIPLGYKKKYPPMPRSFAIIRIETDAGYVGYGEASSSYGHMYPLLVKHVVDNILRRVLVGENPLNIQRCKNEMNRYLYPWIGWQGLSTQVVGAIEIALWDILGKEAGTSVSGLWGCQKSEIPLYGTGTLYFGDDDKWHGHFFDKALEHGFKGVKTRIGESYKKDLEQIANVREHIGPDIELMVDAYWSYSLQSAIEIAKDMEPYDIYFFEEPIPQYQLRAYEKLCKESPVPIAVGERIFSLWGFDIVDRFNAGDVFQPDATICGGISEVQKVATLGKASNKIVIPHIGGLTSVGIAANLHLAAVIDSPILEYDLGPYQPLRDEMLKDPVFSLERINNGCLPVPEEPGLGITVDESVFEKYTYKPGKVYPDLYPQFGVGKI